MGSGGISGDCIRAGEPTLIVVLCAAPRPKPVAMALVDICIYLISLGGTALSGAASGYGYAYGVATRTAFVGMRAAVSGVKNPSRIRYCTALAVMGALGGVYTCVLSGWGPPEARH